MSKLISGLEMSPNSQSELGIAIDALKSGGIAVFPTDTVYGIGVAVRYADSPNAIYAAKRRDMGKPIAWLVGGVDALAEYGVDVPEVAIDLAKHHWPGALTVIVKAGSAVPRPFQSACGTIGLRMPASETALALVRAVDPIATSSANVSGTSDSGSLLRVDRGLLAIADAVVEGAEVPSGVASTVVDCSGGDVVVLRQGGVVL